jgi:hypothetical protein
LVFVLGRLRTQEIWPKALFTVAWVKRSAGPGLED